MFKSYYQPPDDYHDRLRNRPPGPCEHESVTDWELTGAGWLGPLDDHDHQSSTWVETFERACLDCGEAWEHEEATERVEVKGDGDDEHLYLPAEGAPV